MFDFIPNLLLGQRAVADVFLLRLGALLSRLLDWLFWIHVLDIVEAGSGPLKTSELCLPFSHRNAYFWRRLGWHR